ncbi:hypothetical protein B0J13DRAFT_645744 [Dactylonectria estremocensis]|uniref:Short-chain dehydrogenase n=1 Tax=Dactylonectria estremocensis TaxID=1079267 RepID=A0A9P9DZ51_9HYPO|nr:hypothetical protein B0J13DRAFT_645744 [Dactylonectria estremocensis]
MYRPVGDLTGKVVFITGANQGIGLEAARALHASGATVFLGVRDLDKGKAAVEDVKSSPDPSNQAPIPFIELSLDSLESARAAVKAFLAQSTKPNILILNVGVMATPEGRTKDGFETQFGVNHLGHFLLFTLLKSALLEASTASFNSRVISVSSVGHRLGGVRFHDFYFDQEGSYQPWLAYGQAKTSNIYLANEIERRYGSDGLHALSLHPGAIVTNLVQYMDESNLRVILEGIDSGPLKNRM